MLPVSPFLYRCPVTGYRVQGFIADNPAETDGSIYEPLHCTLCGRIHLVDPKTGKVLDGGEAQR